MRPPPLRVLVLACVPLVAGVSAGSPLPARVAAADPVLSVAARLVAEGRLEEAERRLRQALASPATAADPRVADALGSVLARTGRPADAVLLYRRAVESDPNDGAFRKNLANALFASQRIDEGERELFLAVDLAADPLAVVDNGRRLLGLARRPGRALALAARAAARFPGRADLAERHAEALLRAGDREGAADAWERLARARAISPERVSELRPFLSMVRLSRRRPPPPPRPPARPTSVLLVTLDTTRADAVAGGAIAPPTPSLSALAKSAVTFSSARSSAPVTLPAHASILTGRFPPSHGVRNNGVAALERSVPTLASTLASRGFATGAFVSSWILARAFGLDAGFDEYDDRFAHPRQAGSRAPVDRRGAETVGRATRWISQLPADRPFFAWVHLYDPHADYAPPPPYDGAWADDPYAGEVAYTDLCVGRLLADLDLAGRAASTLVVVTADHGEGLGDHGETTHGLFLYDSTIRVPLFVRDPTRGAAGRVDRAAIRHVDLLPTILDRLGVPPPPGLDGASQAARLSGGSSPAPGPAFAETVIPADLGWSPLRAAVDGARKFVLAPRPELYDLSADPAERRNLLAGRGAIDAAEELRRFVLRQLAIPAPSTRRSLLDEEAIARLRSLGYFAAGGDPSPGATATDVDAELRRPDPKDRVDSFRAYQSAISAADDGAWDAALAKADALIGIDPESPLFLALRAEFRDSAGDRRGAVVDAEGAVRAAPADARYRFLAGLARYRRSDLAAAETHWREAVRLDPAHLLAHYNLGRLLLEQQRWDDGERETLAALALAPEHPQARNNLGFLRIRRDRNFDAGIEEIRRATRAAPRDPLLADSLAWALRNAGRRDEARAEMARALDLAAARPSLPAGSMALLAAHAKDLGLAFRPPAAAAAGTR